MPSESETMMQFSPCEEEHCTKALSHLANDLTALRPPCYEEAQTSPHRKTTQRGLETICREREMPGQPSASLITPLPLLQFQLPSDYNHIKCSKTESPSHPLPKFLTHRNHEIIKLWLLFLAIQFWDD